LKARVNRSYIGLFRLLKQPSCSDVGKSGIMRSFSFVLGGLSLLAVLIPIFFNSQTGVFSLSPVLTLFINTVCSSKPLVSNSPHFPGWSTWFHPERLISTLSPVRFQEWSILHHLGGNGPWIQRVTPGSPENSPPKHCSVEQVHLVRGSMEI
jgi:hypothetical protein